jgi:hypothetical protein
MWMTPIVPWLPFPSTSGTGNPPRPIEESEYVAGGVQMPLAGATLLNRTIHQGDAHGAGSMVPKPCERKSRATLGSRFALQAPERIAGGVKTDYLSVGIRVGNRRVGVTADQAWSPH